MTLHTYTVCAYYMCTLFVITVGTNASCDNTRCVICNTDGTCAQCKDGYHIVNGNCYSCQAICLSCTEFNHCKVCNDGFYIFESDSYTSCNKCPTNCVKCNSTIFCSKCKSGYYSKTCGINCNMCIGGACSKTSCTHGCKDGYYQYYSTDNYGYCLKCTANCKTCTNNSHCNTCQDGFYLLNYAYGNTCNPCRLSCMSCSSSSVCDSCPRGRWKSTCESHCQVGCKNNTCDIYTGLCNEGCAEGYYIHSDGVCNPCLQSSSGCHCPDFLYYNGNMCLPCADGYWGRLCIESCNSNCLERKCDNANGHCNNCNQTHYGHFCEYKCNSKCINPSYGSSVCNNSGECLFGCQNGWAGRTCNTVDLTSETSSQLTTSLTAPVSTTPLSELTSSRCKQQTEDESDVPVAFIAGSVGGAVFFLIIGVCIGAVITVLYLKRRNNPSSTDTASTSRTDPLNETSFDTDIGSMTTYTDLSHVSGEETPYSTMTRTEYENMNV